MVLVLQMVQLCGCGGVVRRHRSVRVMHHRYGRAADRRRVRAGHSTSVVVHRSTTAATATILSARAVRRRRVIDSAGPASRTNFAARGPACRWHDDSRVAAAYYGGRHVANRGRLSAVVYGVGGGGGGGGDGAREQTGPAVGDGSFDGNDNNNKRTPTRGRTTTTAIGQGLRNRAAAATVLVTAAVTSSRERRRRG